MKKIAIGGIVHETNAFSDMKAALPSFENNLYLTGGDMIAALANTPTPMGGALAALEEGGYAAVPLMYASANPCGEMGGDVFYALLDDLAGRLTDAAPVDGVLLILHGAMTAAGLPDCEGEILRRVRGVVGYSVPMVTVLDFHANISRAMFDKSDMLVGYDKNPHIDAYEKSVQAVEQLGDILATGTRPHKKLIQLPLVLSPLTNWTDANPFCAALETVGKWRRDKKICCVTAAGGYAYTQNEDAGVSVAVYGDDPAAIEACAYDIADTLWQNRQAALYTGMTVDQAIGRAFFSPERTVALADMGDNIGGGATGDGTHILERLICMGVKNAFVTVCDPVAVNTVQSNYFSGEAGGKSGEQSGRPVAISGPVIWRGAGVYRIGARNPYSAITGAAIDMGSGVAVDAGGVHVLITSKAAPQGDLDLYHHIGVDPRDYKILAVKGAVAFRDAYASVCGLILDVNTDGVCNCDLARIPYAEPLSLKYPINPARVWPGMKGE